MQRPDSKHWSTGALLSGDICQRYSLPYLLFICDFIVILQQSQNHYLSITHLNSLSLAPKPILLHGEFRKETSIHSFKSYYIPFLFASCLYIVSLLTVFQHYSQCKKASYWGTIRTRLTPVQGLLLCLFILPDCLESTKLKFLDL